MKARTLQSLHGLSLEQTELRSKVEHVFAHQKARMRLTVIRLLARTDGSRRLIIGLARAEAAITLANMAYNMTRWRWLNGRVAPA